MGMKQADFSSAGDLTRFVNNALRVSAATVAVGGGGSGYEVGDRLTLSGGECCGAPAILEVTTAPGGVISAVTVYNSGAYFSVPANPVSVSGGKGSGAQFNLTTIAAINVPGDILRILANNGRWYVEYFE